MAKNEGITAENGTIIESQAQLTTGKKRKAGTLRVKSFQMAIGADLIASKMSMAESKNVTLEAMSIGIKMKSLKSRRIIVIPYTNVKAMELFWEDDGE